MENTRSRSNRTLPCGAIYPVRGCLGHAHEIVEHLGDLVRYLAALIACLLLIQLSQSLTSGRFACHSSSVRPRSIRIVYSTRIEQLFSKVMRAEMDPICET